MERRAETLHGKRRDGKGEEGISRYVPGDALYPELLTTIHSPPNPLFAKGEVESCMKRPVKVAIVGSRDCDQEGYHIAFTLARDLARRGACVVSGLALGIDAAAHEGALASGRSHSTIAVLANGLDQVYPVRHRALAQRMLETGGLLLSEQEAGVRPYPSYFLERNRIISGLSLCTIVVQAALRSGALSTARSALEQGRDVMAVPGPWGNRRYEGTNALIKQGAYIVTSVDDVLELLPSTKVSGAAKDPIVQFIERHSGCSLPMLYASFPQGDLEDRLLEFELSGEIIRLPGNLFRRSW